MKLLISVAFIVLSVTASDSERRMVVHTSDRGSMDIDAAKVDSITFDKKASPTYPRGMRFIAAMNKTFPLGADGFDDYLIREIEVLLTYDFWIDTTEVTRGDYDALMKTTYSSYTTPDWNATDESPDDMPVANITWSDAALYCNARSKRDLLDTVYIYSTLNGTPGNGSSIENYTSDFSKGGYRLPTEAEWEYACRGGTRTYAYWGERGEDELRDLHEWYLFNSGEIAHEVAGKLPNPFGLYDMLGNVAEYCNDWYAQWYFWSARYMVDPIGPSRRQAYYIQQQGRMREGGRAIRGGSSREFGFSAIRWGSLDKDHLLGFRAVLPLKQ